MKFRTYRDLSRLASFEERYEYLRIGGEVGATTFGWERYINQMLYHSKKWRKTRDAVIIRDEGCDLGHPDFEIRDRIIVHHMNPLNPEDVEEDRDYIYDPDLLICTSRVSHNAIHYGDASLLPKSPIERKPWDTCPWRM